MYCSPGMLVYPCFYCLSSIIIQIHLRNVLIFIHAGNLESSPVLKYKSSDNCDLELTWHTATACPLKTVTGKNCAVSDEESGLTFDLGRLTRKSNQDMYHVRSFVNFIFQFVIVN